MNAKKVFHIAAVFCLVVMMLAPLARASAEDNNHSIKMSGLPTNSFQGYGWPEGTLELVNDHDPRPLHYEFMMEREGEFEWTSEERGPREWVASIKRIGEPADKAR